MMYDEIIGLLPAYIDGELDPVTALEVEARMSQSLSVRGACERLRDMSAAVREGADYHAAPDWLAARVREALPADLETPRARPAWTGWLISLGSLAAVGDWMRPAASFAAVAMVTWVVALGALRPGADERISRDLLASHVRATLANRYYDVASSDQHTVKPWLSARLAFSPPVADLSASGFELVGGRLDYIGGQPVAVLVYKRREHLIDVFVWPSDGSRMERRATLDGFDITRFERNGMSFSIVSDLAGDELDDLVHGLGGRVDVP